MAKKQVCGEAVNEYAYEHVVRMNDASEGNVDIPRSKAIGTKVPGSIGNAGQVEGYYAESGKRDSKLGDVSYPARKHVLLSVLELAEKMGKKLKSRLCRRPKGCQVPLRAQSGGGYRFSEGAEGRRPEQRLFA